MSSFTLNVFKQPKRFERPCPRARWCRCGPGLPTWVPCRLSRNTSSWVWSPWQRPSVLHLTVIVSHIPKIELEYHSNCISEINLNGGIVSNKGFILQMAGPGIKAIDGKYVSAWGGIQSAGQTIGQIVCLLLHLSVFSETNES